MIKMIMKYIVFWWVVHTCLKGDKSIKRPPPLFISHYIQCGLEYRYTGQEFSGIWHSNSLTDMQYIYINGGGPNWELIIILYSYSLGTF